MSKQEKLQQLQAARLKALGDYYGGRELYEKAREELRVINTAIAQVNEVREVEDGAD